MLFDAFNRMKKQRPTESPVGITKFSEPITIYLNKVKSVDVLDYSPSTPPKAVVELTPYTVTCLKDAIDLNRSIVRDVRRRLNPMEGDLVYVVDEDPTDVYRQILFEIVKRGKI